MGLSGLLRNSACLFLLLGLPFFMACNQKNGVPGTASNPLAPPPVSDPHEPPSLAWLTWNPMLSTSSYPLGGEVRFSFQVKNATRCLWGPIEIFPDLQGVCSFKYNFSAGGAWYPGFFGHLPVSALDDINHKITAKEYASLCPALGDSCRIFEIKNFGAPRIWGVRWVQRSANQKCSEFDFNFPGVGGSYDRSPVTDTWCAKLKVTDGNGAPSSNHICSIRNALDAEEKATLFSCSSGVNFDGLAKSFTAGDSKIYVFSATDSKSGEFEKISYRINCPMVGTSCTITPLEN